MLFFLLHFVSKCTYIAAYNINCLSSLMSLLCLVSAETLALVKSLHSKERKSPYESLEDILKRNAQREGYQFGRDTPKDGNCMFHALADQLKRVKSHNITHINLRIELVQHLSENPNLVIKSGGRTSIILPLSTLQLRP